MLEINKIYNEDCLESMKKIDDKSIDFIFTDLPYGTTHCKWDSIIDLDLLWEQYKRIIKDNGCIALFAQTPFDKVLGASNLNMLRYEWIWEKTQATGHLNAKKMPMKAHENILIFYKKLPIYNPQKTTGHKDELTQDEINQILKGIAEKKDHIYVSEVVNPKTGRSHFKHSFVYANPYIPFSNVPEYEFDGF